MMKLNEKSEWKLLLVLGIVIGTAIATPMYYKKKSGDDTYEPDLIPVSSTVIPLISYQVNSTGEAKHHSIPLSEEYRIAFLKYLRKRINQEADDPDTLITLTKKYHPGKKPSKLHKDEVAKVESITVSDDVYLGVS